jgi:hypothetical protein
MMMMLLLQNIIMEGRVSDQSTIYAYSVKLDLLCHVAPFAESFVLFIRKGCLPTVRIVDILILCHCSGDLIGFLKTKDKV